MSIFSQFFSANTKNAKVKILTRDTFNEAITSQKVHLIDVRTSNEFGVGHIKGAINLNFFDQPTFQKGIEKLNKNTAVYLYCQSGNRSKSASKFLVQMGFEHVFDLQGGYSNW